MLIAMLLAMQVTSEPPRITVSQGENGYRAEATTFDVTQESYVLGEIDRRAVEFCAGKEIDWGEFGSLAKVEKDLSKGPPQISGFYKEFRCIVPIEPVVASVSSNWEASGSDDAEVRRFFNAYYSRRDAGQFDAASAMFQPGVQDDPSPDRLHEFNRKLGSGARRITGVTWYLNPAGAPRPGAYAALDFVGEYSGVHVYCGYLVLYRLGPGKYEIVREEQNIFEKGTESADPAQITSMRAAVCRGS